MNRSFINLIVEGYINDNDLNIDDKNNKSQKIFDLMEEIKTKDYELYNYIHTLSKPNQKDLIYSVLNEFDIKDYVDISGYGWYLFVACAVLLLYSQITRPNTWNRLLYNVSNIGRFFINIKKAFTDTFDKPTKAFEIIVTNKYNDCINRCELSSRFSERSSNRTLIYSLRKLYSQDGFSSIIKKRNWFSIISLGSPSEYLTRDQVECILTCSLDSISTLIAKYAGLYIECVRRSDVLYSDMKIYSTLDLGRIPTNISSCNELRDNYTILLEQYIYILKFVFTNDVGFDERNSSAQLEHKRWMDILNRKINAASENNYSKLLDISKQFIGDSYIKNSNVRF